GERPAAAPAPGPPAADDEPVPLPRRLATATTQRLFGRDEELAALARALDRARRGDRRVVLLTGDPGIGKTRLLAQAGLAAAEEGATVLYGRCDADLGMPYQPFVEALGHLAEHAPAALLERHRGGVLGRLVPRLRDDGPAPAASAALPDADRYLLFAEATALLAAVPRRPLVLLLDDLHAADRPTLMLLRYLLGAPAPLETLVVATYRATEVGDDHPLAAFVGDVTRDAACERIALGGLGQADVLGLTAALAGHDLDAQVADLARALRDETDGNPFFVTAVFQHLAESGDLVVEAGRWSTREPGAELELPGSVRETIVRRVGRLGEDAAAVLHAAATIGEEFEAGLLARTLERDEDDVLDALDAAVAAGLVTVPSALGTRYAFAHALVAHTLYGDLPPGRRRRLHRRIAAALEDACGGDPGTRIGELAHHAIKGAYSEDVPRAIDWARRAGEHALDQLAPDDAERWFERALALLEQLPDDPALRCDLLIGLGTAQRESGHASFRRTLLDAADLARDLDDGERLARAALANTRGFVSATGAVDDERVAVVEAALALTQESSDAVRARLQATLAAELTFAGDWRRRAALSDLALDQARACGDPAVLRDVLSARFMTIWTPETLEQRLRDTAEELELAEHGGDPIARFRALHWRATACLEAGEVDEAARLIEREARLAERIGQPTALWLAAYDRAIKALVRGLTGEAETWAETARRIAVESGQPEALAFYVGQLINIRYEQGRLGELEPLIAAQVEQNPGIPAFRSALALARADAEQHDAAREVLDGDAAAGFSDLPYDSNWLVGMTIYAEAAGRIGHEAAAAVLHPLLEPWHAQIAFNSATAWGTVDRHLGNLAAVLGRRDEAEERLRRAAALHERIAAPLWLARTRADLAAVLGPGDEARELVEQARVTARELGAAAIERRANTLAEELG
ncbi:MAG TPA: AAA family ATPase, partial [Solirubrobacteraceae bacterium]|nr:AAA family ATPase [Solirubrobacteraceae bacterium]